MARKSLDSGNCSDVLFEITLPTKISPGLTNVPTVTIPSSFKCLTSDGLKFGIFFVVCSDNSKF